MLQCWQEYPSDRPTFVQLRAQFDLMLSKQKNAEELYIFIQADETPQRMDLEAKLEPELTPELKPELKPEVATPLDEDRPENPYVENPIYHDHHLSHPDLTLSPTEEPGKGNHCLSHSFAGSTAGAFTAE